MDHAMHDLWLRAQRRIDGALAGIAACAAWLVGVAITVMVTDLHWTSPLIVAALIVIPLAAVFLRPLNVGVQVAGAIEQRDADELARWRQSGVPLRYPELLRARLMRVHYPMLGVVVLFGVYVAIISLVSAAQSDLRGQTTYSIGFALIGVGVALGAIVLSQEPKLTPRGMLTWLVATLWLVPLGVGTCGWAMVVARVEISAGSKESYSSVVFAVFGVLVVAIAVAIAAVWVAWLGRALSGRFRWPKRSIVSEEEQQELDRFAVEKATGTTGEIPQVSGQLNTAEFSMQLVGLSPEIAEANGVDEFDEHDVQIISLAMTTSVWQGVSAALIVIASVTTLVLTMTGQGNTLIHGGVAVVLIGAMAAEIAQARRVHWA